MRLKKVTAKNGNTTYSIIRDYTNLKGKRTTCTYETLGNIDNLKKRFGEENTMKELEKYISELNNKIKANKEEMIFLELNPNKKIDKDVDRHFFIGHIFLRKIYYDLGIDSICENIKEKYKFTFDINSIVECLLFSRIIWPSSKLSTYKQSRNFIDNYDFDIQHVYRTLTYLSREMENIQKQLFDNSNKIINRNYKVIYYDCTNYFFYTEENEFQRYGISKQHQPLPLVQMGLFMDADGYPFAMNINPGNTNECKTLIPTEKNFLENYNIKGKNIIICTDAGLCSNDIKKFNIEEGRGFVITQSIKGSKKELKDFALDKSGWHILGNLKDIYNLEEANGCKDFEEFKKKHKNTIFYKEIECETKSVKQTLIITFSFKYQEYQHNLKLAQFERAQKLVEETNKKNEKVQKKEEITTIKLGKNINDPKRFIKIVKDESNNEKTKNEEIISEKKSDKNMYKIKYEINQEIFDEEEKFNGLYGISTNLIDDTETIIKVMKGRWEIEESFRIMKNEFDSGTVYLSREDRIKGHFITCFLSLFIYRYLEHQLNDKYTVHELITKLQEMKLLEHKGKGYVPTYTRTDLTDDLHRFLGIDTDNQVITYKKIKKILSTYR